MMFPGAALSAVGRECVNENSCGYARMAMVATGAVGKSAAAAKTSLYQLIIDLAINQVIRRCYLSARQSFREIAARIGLRGVKFERR